MSERYLSSLSRKLIPLWKQQISRKLSSLISLIWLGGLGLAILALWGFAEISAEVLDNQTQALDTAILLTLKQFQGLWLNRIMVGVTFLGNPSTLIVIVSVLGIISLVKQRWAEVATLAIASGGAIGLNNYLKVLFSRQRPELWDRLVDVNSYSFPSGHAMISLVVYGVISYWFVIRYPAWQGWIYSVAVLLIAAIGLSRLYLGVHWPTDVIAGFAAGFVWLISCLFTLELLKKRLSKDNSLEESPS